MPQVVTTNLATTADNTPAITLANGDTLFVSASATVTASGVGSPALRFGGSTDITIDGTLYAARAATLEGTLSNADLHIGSSGNIFGARYGVDMAGAGNRVTNAGEINVNLDGIYINGGNSYVVNDGQILSSSSSGVYINGTSGGGGIFVLNNGTIHGDSGLYLQAAANTSLAVHNVGTILSSGSAAQGIFIDTGVGYVGIDIRNDGYIEQLRDGHGVLLLGPAADITLANNGEIVGDVLMSGADIAVTNVGSIDGELTLNASNGVSVDNRGYLGDDVRLNTTAGADVTLDSFSGVIAGDITTGVGNDQIIGSDTAVDRIFSGGGDDVLQGNGGNDFLDGGAGADDLSGGAGIDTASYSSAFSGVSANLGNASANSGDAQGDSYEAIENLSGGTFDDTLTGNGAVNRLSGGSGNDALNGLDGNDTLSGGLGDDSMTGGNGDDLYIVEQAGDVVIEAASGGSDVVRAGVSWVLGTGQAVERVQATGVANLDLAGNELVNLLIGNSGNNALNGGSGIDTLRGGKGNDQYIIDNAADSTVELLAEGLDIVISSISHTLANHIEQLLLTGVTDINGIGNSVDNMVVGNDGNNQLNGKGGVDSLSGGLGNDTYIFNAGQGSDDTISDFAGNGAAAGDLLRFIGYGTVAQGATFVQLNATQWQVNSFDNAIQEVINFSNSAAIHASDLIFN
ncbi:MAG TPA: calcium-binding protein [Solimonas sp.]|nr:calcium-binding protein [Solimonas sp.]